MLMLEARPQPSKTMSIGSPLIALLLYRARIGLEQLSNGRIEGEHGSTAESFERRPRDGGRGLNP